jgi:hypothetical protein
VLVGAVVLVAATPVHVTIFHAASDSPALRVNGRPVTGRRRPAVGDLSMRIENTSAVASYVDFTFPRFHPFNNELPPSRMNVEAGDWREWELGGRLLSVQPGSVVSFRGRASGLKVGFVRGPDRGTVRVNSTVPLVLTGRDGPMAPTEEVRISLRSKRTGLTEVWLPSTRAATALSVLFLFRDVRLAVENASEDAMVHVSVGNAPWVERPLPPGREMVLPARQCLRAIVGCYLGAMKLALHLLVSIVVLGLAGQGLLGRGTLPQKLYYSAPIGFAAYALLASSLSYFVPAETGVYLVLVPLLGVAVRGAWVLREILSATPRWPAHALRASPWVASAGLLLAGSYWPALYVGEWFNGLYQTDTAYNANLVASLRTADLFTLDSLQGFGMRALDLVLASHASILLGESPQHSVLFVALLGHLLCAPLTYAAARILTLSKTAGATLALAIIGWPTVGSLYMEGYFSQHVLTFGLVFSLAAAFAVLREVSVGTAPELTRRSVLCFAAATAFCVSLYPYFTVVPFFLALTIVAYTSMRARLRFWSLCATTGAVLGMIGMNLLVAINVGETRRFVDGLNAIARNWVFPFLNQPRFFAFALGLTPFHTSVERLRSVQREFTDAGLLWGMLEGQLHVTHSGLTVVAAFLFVLWLVVASGIRCAWPWQVVAMAVVLLGQVLVAAVLGLTGQVYAYAKFVWSIGTLVPVTVGPLVWFVCASECGERRFGSSVRGTCVMLVVTWGILAGGATLSNHLQWFGNGVGAALERTHLPVGSEVMRATRALVPHLTTHRASSFAFKGRAPGLRGTDHDYVLGGHLSAWLSRRGLECMNCWRSPVFGTVTGWNESFTGEADIEIAVMVGDQACGDARSPIYRGEFFTVCAVGD